MKRIQSVYIYCLETHIAALKLILIHLFYICLVVTNHNHYNFADSTHQHYKKHIVEEISLI